MATVFSIPLEGSGGEPVDLRRTFLSHGVADLPPMRVVDDGAAFEATLSVPRSRPRTITIAAGPRNRALVEVAGRALSTTTRGAIERHVRHILRLDEDLSAFYELCRTDRELSWACAGAGRMMRNPTVFEEVVKTICTTNCAWSATVRMVTALVSHLGEAAQGASEPPWGRSFPTPAAMAAQPERFYRDVVRAGYRGPYLREIAARVASGDCDLEALASPDVPENELEEALLALPGVGPYAAAHIMMMVGRYSRLILDSWTRPKYARLLKKKSVADRTIVRRFKPYGQYAGLAFWLFLTRDWVADEPTA